MVVRIETAEELDQASESIQENLADVKGVQYQHASADGSDQDSAASSANATSQPIQAGPKVGRNDPCPCGSGKKYKHCHGQLS
jgi:preprotein translocase subunit SecA